MISTVEKVLFLKSIDLFSQIPGEDLSQIALITDEVIYDEGETVFSEGDPGDSLFFVVEGQVQIHRNGTPLATGSEKQVFGEMAVLDGELRSASILALTDLILLKIHRDDFREILREKPEIAEGIIHVLSRRLRQMLNDSTDS